MRRRNSEHDHNNVSSKLRLHRIEEREETKPKAKCLFHEIRAENFPKINKAYKTQNRHEPYCDKMYSMY